METSTLLNKQFMERAILIAYCLLNALILNAAPTSSISYNINWQNNQKITFDTQEFELLKCTDCYYDIDNHKYPIYSQKLPIGKNTKANVKITNAVWQNTNLNCNYCNSLTNTIKPQVYYTTERLQDYIIIKIVPVRKTSTGTIQTLQSFNYQITEQYGARKSPRTTKNYAEQSVFSQGTLYKVAIANEGIHKIDKPFLQNLGVDVNSIQMQNIRVYGNGGGMLPELAGAPVKDDLFENAIKVVDNNNNNQFDDDDYFLFYAEPANVWRLNNENRFEFHPNIYTDRSFYFLNFDIGAGQRVQTEIPLTDYDYETSNFDALAAYEPENQNLNNSGRRWYGNTILPNETEAVSFNFPNINQNENIWAKFRLAGCDQLSTTSFNIYNNNSFVATSSFNPCGSSAEGPLAKANIQTHLLTASQNINLNLTFNSASSASRGYVDYLNLNARSNIVIDNNTLQGGQFIFHDRLSTNKTASKFNIQSSVNGLTIWAIDNNLNTTQVNLNNGTFITATAILKKFVAFTNQFYTPEAIGSVASQNIHGQGFPDFVIVSHQDFLPAAQQLAQYHRDNDNMDVLVVELQQVYNEFSAARQDITAIRNLMKMFYDKAALTGNPDLLPENLLLFGDASYDYKSKENPTGNSNFVPTFESYESLHRAGTYCTDDYFAFLDDNEGANVESNSISLDIGVGRLPVKTLDEAYQVVNKVLVYKDKNNFGAWLNNVTFIADDGNGNLHMRQSDGHANKIRENRPEFNVDKIYADAYKQYSTSGGNLYPDVSNAINNKIFTGSLLINFTGHGGPGGWTSEKLLTRSMIQNWSNLEKMPVFVTATCSFTLFDEPNEVSAGEQLILKADGGAIVLMTTVRVVFAGSNELLNDKFLVSMFDPTSTNRTIGDIARIGKNTSIATALNTRKFVLMGNPALKLNFASQSIQTTNIQTENTSIDTLKALQQITVSGQITDASGNLLNDFNGTIAPVIFDKQQTLTTLGNDLSSSWSQPGDPCNGTGDEYSCPENFDVQKSIIFKGNATVTNGQFNFSFVVPKDIDYTFGNGRLSYHAVATDGRLAAGFDNQVIIGGITNQLSNDNEGPLIDLYLNDESFVYGGLTNNTPLLIVNLNDDNGINTVGRGIGHDLTALLNENTAQPIVLNDYYESELDNFTQGQVLYPLEQLENGRHSISIKAWDVLNNSSDKYTEFVVADSEDLALSHVLNYPNPFTTKTNFWFEHNRAGDQLNVTVRVFTVSGKLVKSLQTVIPAANTRVTDLEWNGLDDFGNKIGKGVYVYQLTVIDSNGNKADEIEKLVVLK